MGFNNHTDDYVFYILTRVKGQDLALLLIRLGADISKKG